MPEFPGSTLGDKIIEVRGILSSVQRGVRSRKKPGCLDGLRRQF